MPADIADDLRNYGEDEVASKVMHLRRDQLERLFETRRSARPDRNAVRQGARAGRRRGGRGAHAGTTTRRRKFS